MSDVTDRTPPTSSARRWGVRIAFGAAVLLIPLQLIVKVTAGREPYPALTQPAFAYAAAALHDDIVKQVQAEIDITFSDSSTETVTAAEVVGWTAGISPTTIVTEALLDRQPDPATLSWLAGRISAALPGQTAESARIVLYSVSTDPHTLEIVGRTITDEVTVDLRGQQ